RSDRSVEGVKPEMPRGAPGRRGRTRHVCQGPGDPGPPVKNGPVWRNPGHAPSRRATPLIGGTEKETGRPQARPNPGTRSLGCLASEWSAATLPSPRDGRRYFAEVQSPYTSESSFVMAGLVPAIHVLLTWGRKTWMPATSAGMTRRDSSKLTLSS